MKKIICHALNVAQASANCDCGFSAEICKTNPCMRKKMATSGLVPEAKYPYCGTESAAQSDEGLINGTYPLPVEHYERKARNLAAVWSNGNDGARTCILAALLRAAAQPGSVAQTSSVPVDPTAQSGILTRGQKIVADYERDMIAEPCELAAAIDKALAQGAGNSGDYAQLEQLHGKEVQRSVELEMECTRLRGLIRYLSDYSDAEIASEYGSRIQRALGDQRECVGVAVSSTHQREGGK